MLTQGTRRARVAGRDEQNGSASVGVSTPSLSRRRPEGFPAPGSAPAHGFDSVATSRRMRLARPIVLLARRMGALLGATTPLTALSLCGIALFCLAIFARPTTWYSTDPTLTAMRAGLTIRLSSVPIATRVVIKGNQTVTENVGSNAVLVKGAALLPLLLQWSAVLGTALCAAGALHSLQARRGRERGGRHGGAAAVRRAAAVLRYIAHYELPPRRFWAWWSGGMSVVDALLVSAWLGLAVCFLWIQISSKFAKAAGVAVPTGDLSKGLTQDELQSVLANALRVKRQNITAKAFGEVLRVLMLVMFYPVSRSNILAWLFRTDHSSLLRYHRWMGYGTVFVAFLHGLLYCIIWGLAGTLVRELMFWESYSRPNLAGLISLIAGLVMCGMSLTWVRRNFYWLFYHTHIVGFLVWTLFALMHYKALANWIVPGLVLYGLDRSFRLWQALCNVVHLPAADVAVNGCTVTLKLRWSKGAAVAAGQTVYLRCRQVSHLQAHPFTLASVSSDERGPTGVLHIKVQGQWTNGLRKLAASGAGLSLQVEGPYESSLLQPPQTPVVVMIAGGIGITPLKGLLESYDEAARHSLGVGGMRQRLAASTSSALPGATHADAAAASVGHLVAANAGTARAGSRVYLVWSSRKLCELQVLGAQLLRAALKGAELDRLAAAAEADGATHERYDAAGWLRSQLHYTGYVLDGSKPSSGNGGMLGPAAVATAAKYEPRAAARGGATTAHCPGQLSACPSTTPALFMPCAVLSSFGAFGGLVLAWYYDAYAARTTSTGAVYGLVGCVQFVAISIGAIVPPLAFLHLCKLLGPACAALGRRCRWSSGSSDVACSVEPTTLAAYAAGVVALPGCKLGLADVTGAAVGACDPEADAGLGALQLRRGRPDVHALLSQVCEDHAGEPEIEVLVGGPEALYSEVARVCQELSGRSWFGLRGPLLRCRAVAHQH